MFGACKLCEITTVGAQSVSSPHAQAYDVPDCWCKGGGEHGEPERGQFEVEDDASLVRAHSLLLSSTAMSSQCAQGPCDIGIVATTYTAVGHQPTIAHPTQPFQAYVSSATLPEGAGAGAAPRPVVVIMSDIFGFELPNTRLIADMLATSGFTAIVPDFFDGTAWVRSLMQSAQRCTLNCSAAFLVVWRHSGQQGEVHGLA